MMALMRGSAHIPERFWDLMLEVEPGDAEKLKSTGWIERPLSETEAERAQAALAKGIRTACLGDISDKYYKPPVLEDGYIVELEPGKRWFWGVGLGTTVRENAVVFAHRANAEDRVRVMKDQYPEAAVVEVRAERHRMYERRKQVLV